MEQKFMEVEGIATLVKGGIRFQKVKTTLLRLPMSDEIGEEFPTYVKDETSENGIRIESVATIGESDILARNDQVLSYNEDIPIYNECPIGVDIAIKNYGKDVIDSLTTEFTAHRKQATVTAYEITKEFLDTFNEGKPEFKFSVSWSTEPMVAVIGDWLTTEGYSISQHNIIDYARV